MARAMPTVAAGRRRTRADSGSTNRGSSPTLRNSSSTRPNRSARLRADSMHNQRLCDEIADGHARVERRIGILEHDLHVAAHRLELPPRKARDLLAVEPHAAARSALLEPQHQPAGGALAGAGFADKAEYLAAARLRRKSRRPRAPRGAAAEKAAAGLVDPRQVLDASSGRRRSCRALPARRAAERRRRSYHAATR